MTTTPANPPPAKKAAAKKTSSAAKPKTPQEWLDTLLASGPETRLELAAVALMTGDAVERGEVCADFAHDERIELLVLQRDQVIASLLDLDRALDEFSEAARPGMSTVLARIGDIVGFDRVNAEVTWSRLANSGQLR